MEKSPALVDDLVGQRVNGDFKLGEVIQSYSKFYKTCDLHLAFLYK